MGLATPAAIMAGANAAARRGILIRDGVALEKAGKITAVVFDKTGTLTDGKPEVAAVGKMRSAECRSPRVQIMAAALARNSTHPISQAIAKMSDGDTSNWRTGRKFAELALRRTSNSELRTPNSELQTARLGSLRWLQGIGRGFGGGRNIHRRMVGSGRDHRGSGGPTRILLGAVCRARRGETGRGESRSGSFNGRD